LFIVLWSLGEVSVENQKALTLSVTNRVLSENRLMNHLWLIPLAFGFATWEIVTQFGLVPRANLPTLSAVLVTLFSSVQDSTFLIRIAHSFLNLSLGLALAFSVALPVAFVAGSKNWFDLTLTPLVMLFGALPDLSFLPLLVLWFGAGNVAAIIMASVAGFFPIYFTVREGTKSIPRELFDVTSIFRSNRLSTFTKMVLPAISPHMFSGLRLAYDFAWEIIIAIEIATRVAGIGSFIQGTVGGGSLESGFAAILAIAVVAVVVDRAFFGTLEAWARKWA
jgi:ABC-type nitrate/sulfonate/bicarbonate transport system permease component